MSNWQQFTLGDIGKIITGKTPSTTVEDNFGDEYMFITPRDMYGQKYVRHTERNLSEKGLNTVLRNSVPANSICVSCIGSDMGKVVLSTERSVTNQQINSIVVEEHDVEYVYYNLLLRQDEIKSGASGSAVPIMNKSTFSQLPINLPPLPEQKAIAHILGTLDEKIELNRKMNQTLEALAQALFKSWFVDFDPVIDNALAQGNDIPEELQARAEKRRRLVIAGHVIASAAKQSPNEGGPKQSPAEGGMKQSPSSLKPLLHTNPSLASQFPSSFVFDETLGKWIPEGWEVKRIGECDIYISDFVANGSFASLKENVTLYPDKKEYALFMRNTDLKSGFEKKVYVDKRSYEFLKKSRLLGGEVIISNVGDVGSVYRCPDLDIPMTLGNNVILLNSTFNNFLYQFFICPLGQALIDGIKGGSAQPKFNKTDFKSQSILFPSQEILAEFERIDSLNRAKLESDKKEIESLTQLRDRLLPELISGRVRVKEEIIFKSGNHE